jgi:hypothetical protein
MADIFREEFLQQLLQKLYDQDCVKIYDDAVFNASERNIAESNLHENPDIKDCADQLVREKLADFDDKERTILRVTNFGRYWIIHGGYEVYLRDGKTSKGRQKHPKDDHDDAIQREKENLVEARLKLTHYRLVGFWLTLVISIIGFLLSLYNLYLILGGTK